MIFQTYLAAWNYKRVNKTKKQIVKLNFWQWGLK